MQLVKFGLEMGPLAVFFLANNQYDIITATVAFMVATVISLIVMQIVFKRIPVMPLVTGIFVIVFGGLTWLLNDALFIKIKPTIVNVLFASALGGGLLLGYSLMKILLGEVIRLRDEGWRKLTIRWAFFFLFLAVLNEIVWRNFSDSTWAAFKLFGVMPITMAFMLAQIGLLQKYQIENDVTDISSK